MMQFSKNVRAAIIAHLCVGLLVPVTNSHGDEPVAMPLPGITIVDVELARDSVLHGTVLDEHGAIQPGRQVSVRGIGEAELLVVSDENGKFQFPMKRGGTYQLASCDRVVNVRCWTHGAAPPHAIQGVTIGGQQVVRAQVPPSCWGLSNPWVIAGLTVVAIAVPVALYQNRDDRPDASE
jgi:hypothetical protein